MGFFLVFSLFFNLPLWAQDPLGSALNSLEHPATLGTVTCSETHADPACEDLAARICAIKESGSNRDTVERSLQSKSSTRLSDTESHAAILAAEAQTTSLLPVTREDIGSLFNDIRTRMIRAIIDNPQIPASQKTQMNQVLSGMTLGTSEDYISATNSLLHTQYPTATDAQVLHSTLAEYDKNCGPTGTLASAFSTGATFHICPGLLLDTLDSGAKTKDEFLNSLSLVMAHEIGHGIDTRQFPSVYEKMGQCFNNIKASSTYWTDKSDEASADYWGARVFSDRLRDQGLSGGAVVRSASQALGKICNDGPEIQYPAATDRINLILGRNPTFRQTLNCPSAPVCGLNGLQ